MPWRLIAILTVAGGIVLAIILAGGSDDGKDRAIALVESWKIGDSGAEHWKESMKLLAVRPFAVRSYEHLKSEKTSDTSACHRFRIHSSTQGGLEITKDWEIYVEKTDRGWLVVLVIP